MAFKSGTKAELTINTKALSLFMQSANIATKLDTSDTTTFTLTWHTFIGGLLGGQFSCEGYYDPTVTTGPASVLVAAQQGAVPIACVFYPAGNNAGQGTSHTFSALVTDYTEGASVNDRVTLSASFLLTGADTVAQL